MSELNDGAIDDCKAILDALRGPCDASKGIYILGANPYCRELDAEACLKDWPFPGERTKVCLCSCHYSR